MSLSDDARALADILRAELDAARLGREAFPELRDRPSFRADFAQRVARRFAATSDSVDRVAFLKACGIDPT